MFTNTAFTLALLGTAQLGRAWTSRRDERYFPKPQMMQETAGLTHEICSRSFDRLLYQNEDFN